MTSFSMMLQICGLSIDTAAVYLKTHRRAVIRWTRGAAEPSDDVLLRLGALQARQQDVADAIITSWEEAGLTSSWVIDIARS